MIEQEPQELLKRLERVWEVRFDMVDGRFVARADEQTQIVAVFLDSEETLYIRLILEHTEEGEIASLTFSPYRGVQIASFVAADSLLVSSYLRPFSQKWYPLFRRNCWLSGCNVQATPEEKAEWGQGYTREELEAWDLKM